MKLNLVCIEDCLIHGQISTRWVREINITRIISVNDEFASDHI
ncbi:PTS sugar transporter subunit IIB [Candidatus Pantoea carbekii]|nr:PTS sugar transporter subunit IIB [Candidatus Pantoea carbekii]